MKNAKMMLETWVEWMTNTKKINTKITKARFGVLFFV